MAQILFLAVLWVLWVGGTALIWSRQFSLARTLMHALMTGSTGVVLFWYTVIVLRMLEMSG